MILMKNWQSTKENAYLIDTSTCKGNTSILKAKKFFIRFITFEERRNKRKKQIVHKINKYL